MENNAHVNGVQGLKKRKVSMWGIVFLMYCLVAAGCFGMEEIISESGPGLTLILLVVFPIVWAYPISNICAECAAILPEEGGNYVWVKKAFGEFWGFQSGWFGTISCYVTNGIYVALVASYTSQMLSLTPLGENVIKYGMIIIFTVVNLMGIGEVSKVSTFFSVTIILAFGLVAVVGLLNWQTNPMDPMMPEGYNLIDGLGGGISFCIWMYCGYESISTMTGEIEDPKVVPKGLKMVMPIMAISYFLPTLAALASMPAGSWADWSTGINADGSSMGYATVLTTYLGHGWGYVFLLVAILSQCSMFNSYLASGSRGFFVLGDDNLCPRFLVKVSKKRGVPHIAILSLSAVTCVLCQFDFTTLVMTEVVFILAMYLTMFAAVLKLRKMYPIEERKAKGLYYIKGGKVGIYYCVIFPVIITIIAFLVNGTDYFFIGMIAMFSGPVAYIAFKKIYGGMYKTDPLNNPINIKTGLAFGDTTRIGLFCLLAGVFSFLAQFWFQWYEIDYGEWGPSDYEAFGNIIPQLLDVLLWGDLIIAVIGAVLMVFSKKIEKEENKSNIKIYADKEIQDMTDIANMLKK